MPYPSDVLLPVNAKYYGFTDTKKDYNPNWDIIWSFSYALTGSEHAIGTFLTTNPSISSGIPGQYMGILGDDTVDYLQNGSFSIVFDSTGFFALSSPINYGVGYDDIHKNALIVRGEMGEILLNEPLSSIDDTFNLSTVDKEYKTLRFRLVNAGKKLHIDNRNVDGSYKTLKTLDVDFNVNSNPVVYPSFTYCSPISSDNIDPSSLFMRNFNVQGDDRELTTETIITPPLSTSVSETFITLPSIL